MAIKIRKLSDNIGAEIIGVNPASQLDESTFTEILDVWLEHCILLFRNVSFTPESQITFTRRFGKLHIMPPPADFNLPGNPEIFVVSNEMKNGVPVGVQDAGQGWHSDGEDKLIPNAGSLLYAEKIPKEGGDTQFANMYKAYDALPSDMRELIEGKRVRFSRIHFHEMLYPHLPPLSKQEIINFPDVYHPIVREHPLTGRKALYVGRWAAAIEGMDLEEGNKTLKFLQKFCIQPKFIYRHKWKVGDAMLWDNRCAQHRALPFDKDRFIRRMHRTTLEGDLPKCGSIQSSLETITQ